MNNNKIVHGTIFVLAMVLFPCLSGMSLAEEKNRLIVGWQPGEPFMYIDNTNNLSGLDIELVTSIMGSAGYKVEYVEAPWARQLNWIESGVIQIATDAMKTPERESYAFFSDSYIRESYILFIRKGDASKFKFKSLKDIIGSSFRLGVMRESVYGDEYARLMKDPKFTEHVFDVATDEQNYKMVLAGRIDGFIQEYSRMAIDGKKTGIIEKVEPLLVIEENNLHVMFSKKSTTPETVKLFNEGLKKMRADGTYQRIFEKYNLEKYSMLK